ncbi:MAG: CpsD/CapB family tyrosine-protein kinase [bacterium]
MSRILDALKKAESNRERLGLGPVPIAPPPGREPVAGWSTPTHEAVLATLPLMGGVDLSEDAVRETTALRLNLESAFPGITLRSIMFSSAQSGEGTSTVALQFSQSLAHGSQRVLFVDVHGRRPVCYADESQRYAVLDRRVASPAMAGTLTPNLAAIPISEEAARTGFVTPGTLRSILEAAQGSFDWVVVDSPPVVESPDSAALAAQVDGVVMVLHAGRAKRPVVTRAVEMLRKSGGRVVGSVLNRRVHEIPGFIYRRI